MSYDSVPSGFLGLEAAATGYEDADMAVLPVPYEGTVSYGGGTRGGPSAIIDASRYVETWDERLGLDYGDLKVVTMPDMAVTGQGPQAMVERVEGAVRRLLADGKWVAMLGGEHSITTGAVRAHLERHPDMGVLQIDAHADLREAYEGSPFSHAAVMRRVRELTPRTVAVGIRSLSRDEHDLIHAEGLPVFWAWKLTGDWIDRVLAALPQRVYLTVDIDGLDPSIVPGTGTPEPGGMCWDQVMGLCERLTSEREVVGFDLVEVAPVPGCRVTEFTAAKLAAALMALVARSWNSRGERQ